MSLLSEGIGWASDRVSPGSFGVDQISSWQDRTGEEKWLQDAQMTYLKNAYNKMGGISNAGLLQIGLRAVRHPSGSITYEEIPDDELPQDVRQRKQLLRSEASRYASALSGTYPVPAAAEEAIQKDLRSKQLEALRLGESTSSVTKMQQAQTGAEALREMIRQNAMQESGARYMNLSSAENALIGAYLNDVGGRDVGFANQLEGPLSRISNERMGFAAQGAGANMASQAGWSNMIGQGVTSLGSAGILALAMSDKRSKENIKNLNYDLDTVLKLEPKEFDYKADGSHSIGFIAQDVEKIIPEAVIEGPDGMKRIAYGLLAAVIVKAMKELDDKFMKHVKGGRE